MPKKDLASFCALWTQKRGAKPLQKLRGVANLQSKNLGFLGLNKIRMRSLVPRERNYPKHYVSLTDYPIASDIKPAHTILSLTHTKCRGKPNIRILPPLLQKNKYGRSQLYGDQIFSHTITLTSGNLIGV